MDLVAEVIEGEDAIEEHENAVGDVEIILGVAANVFQLADDVVGAIADGSGGKGRQSFDLCGTVLVEEFLDDVENVGGAGFDFGDAGGHRICFGIAVDGDLIAVGLKAQKWANSQESVAADFFSAFDGLEEKGVRLVGGDGKKCGDRREQVGGDRLGHGHERSGAGEAGEFLEIGADHGMR